MAMFDPVFLIFPVLGLIAGVFAGLLGVGGGILVVPALVLIFGVLKFAPDTTMHLAAGTSLAVMVVTTLASAMTHIKLKNVAWRLLGWLLLGIFVGSFLGTSLAMDLSGQWIEIIFAVVLFLLAFWVWLTQRSQVIVSGSTAKAEDIRLSLLVLIGLMVGGISGLLGIGGGLILMPVLLASKVRARPATGVSAVCTLCAAVLGTINLAASYSTNTDGVAAHFVGIPYTWGFIYVPAWVGIALFSPLGAWYGATLTQRFSNQFLQKLWIALLSLIAILLLLRCCWRFVAL